MYKINKVFFALHIMRLLFLFCFFYRYILRLTSYISSDNLFSYVNNFEILKNILYLNLCIQNIGPTLRMMH